MNFKTSTVAGIVATLLLSGPATAQERLAFGATNSQSAHYAYFAALAQIVNSTYPEKYQVSVVETGATVDNLRRMSRNQLDIGLVTTSTLYQAYNGTKDFEGQAIESKLLWSYSLAPQDVITLRDRGFETLADLEGQRMGPGMRGSSTETTSEEVFELLGITPNWVRGTNAELANAIKDNRAVGFVKSAVGTQFDALTMDIAAFTPLKVLGLSDEQVEIIETELPELSIVEMPGGEMEGTGLFKTWGFMISVSARPDMTDETAYDITKAVMENMDSQEAAFPAVTGLNLAELTVNYATSPLHPGAIRYYEEIGITVPDSLK